MQFINRDREMAQLLRIFKQEVSSFVVVWGRRRLGKSRLLSEWTRRVHGTYWVADESSSAIQRQYLSEELEPVLPGFSAVTYPDWQRLLNRLSVDARHAGWRGPLVLDEFPYMVAAAPELPSILQRWIDREKREGGIVLALAGSSQRMMTDSVLSADAPLYGRADAMFRLEPLSPGYIPAAIHRSDPQRLLDFYTCWGGVPRYWELAAPYGDRYRDALDELVLSPLGVLHDEINRLLHLELPSAISLRPILDSIGLGAHRMSEVASRLGTPATSLSRGLSKLGELGYITRDIPFGENEKRGKKALYRLSDPFLRVWFRMVAPHRGALQAGSRSTRLNILASVWPALRAEAWEDLCRMAVPYLRLFGRDWKPAMRYWQGNESEWDVVSTSLDGEYVVLGECKSLARPAGTADMDTIVRTVLSKTVPVGVASHTARRQFVIFVPEVQDGVTIDVAGISVIDGKRVFGALSEIG
ncbi:MAG: ATP-binding protein [Alkalispirochaeta sp.]